MFGVTDAGLLVERHDGPVCTPEMSSRDELVLGVQKVQAARVELHVAEDHDLTGAAEGCRRGTAWFIHVQRMAPLASPTTALKILKPRRRVIARRALLISPRTAAFAPGRSDAIGCMRLRSS